MPGFETWCSLRSNHHPNLRPSLLSGQHDAPVHRSMITPLSGNETIHMPADSTLLTVQGRSFACLPRLRHLRMHTGSTLCRPKRKNAPESGEGIVELAGLPAGLETLEVRITCQNLPCSTASGCNIYEQSSRSSSKPSGCRYMMHHYFIQGCNESGG